MRLVGGGNPQEGLLEVYYNGIWGTVCRDYFNDVAAGVVCNTLGYGHSGQVICNRHSAGTGVIWLDNVQCSGTEKSIADCQHRGWGNHNCGHAEEVSVSCVIVRLVGGPSPLEGRLEVRYKGIWGTVCNDHFNNAAASVVCHMLGYKRTGRFIGNHCGASNGTIWLDDIQCVGPAWKDTSVSVLTEDGAFRTVDMTKMWLSPALATHQQLGLPFLLHLLTQCHYQACQIHLHQYTVAVIAVVVVVGLIICIIVIGLFLHFRQKPRRERTEVSMIPMPVTASTNGCNNYAFDDTANYEHSADNAQTVLACGAQNG